MFFTFFYWIFSLFILQMLSPFQVSLPPRNTLSHPPSPCFNESVPPPIHSHFPTLISPTLGHLSNLYRAKDRRAEGVGE